MVTDGEFELLLPEHPAIWAFLRRGRDAELLVAANFSADPVSAVLPLDGGWRAAAVALASHAGRLPAAAARPDARAVGVGDLAPHRLTSAGPKGTGRAHLI